MGRTTQADAALKKGSAEMLVLSLLERRARHGYEIAKLIEQRSNGVLTFHAASLYPLLYRMEARRLIQQGGVKLNGAPASGLDVGRDQLAGALLQVGKRRFARLTA